MHGGVDDDSGIKSISIKSDGESAILPSSSETTVTIITADDEEFEIKVSEIFLANGVLYFRVDGLIDTIENAIPEEMAPLMDYFTEVLEEIEGTWWKFDIADFGMPDEVTDMYDCLIGVVGSVNTSDSKDELTKLYKDYPLLDVEKSGDKQGDYDGYDVTLNTANTAGFLNNLRKTDLYDGFAQCMRSVDASFEDYDNISAVDIELPDDMPTFKLYIHPWSHELRIITVIYESDEFFMGGGLTLEFVDSVNISAPEGAKPVMEMFENVMVKMCSLLEAEDGEECMTNLMMLLMSLQGSLDYFVGGEIIYM
jgi:hypothetical protein